MPIQFQCPCGQKLRVTEDYAGKKAKCPGCGEALQVPMASDGESQAITTTASVPPPLIDNNLGIHCSCSQCGHLIRANPEQAGKRVKCPNCSSAILIPGGDSDAILKEITLPELAEDEVEAQKPRLWNPSAAANWCLLLSTGFGAFLHARNWKQLQRPGLARANMVFFWLNLLVLLSSLGLALLHIYQIGPLLATAANPYQPWIILSSILLMLVWYFSLAKKQIRYVKQDLDNHYTKRSMVLAVFFGFLIILGYLVISASLGAIFGVLFYQPDPAALAKELQPQIQAELQKLPQFQGAQIRKIQLNPPRDNVYTGTITLAIGNQNISKAIEISFKNGLANWKIQ